jgi:hypothetical protein
MVFTELVERILQVGTCLHTCIIIPIFKNFKWNVNILIHYYHIIDKIQNIRIFLDTLLIYYLLTKITVNPVILFKSSDDQ